MRNNIKRLYPFEVTLVPIFGQYIVGLLTEMQRSKKFRHESCINFFCASTNVCRCDCKCRLGCLFLKFEINQICIGVTVNRDAPERCVLP